MLFDDADRPIDYRFREVNSAFERQSGIEYAVGRRMLEIAPDHENYWFEIYGQVASTGEPVSFQSPAQALGRLFDVYAFRIDRPEQRRVAVRFTDITERNQVEEKLRRYAAELEQLNEANRPLLREVDHRVKNNLTAILALIFAEQRRLSGKTCDPDAPIAYQGALEDLGERVRSLAAVHSMLSASGWRSLRVDQLVGEVIQASMSAAGEAEALVLKIGGAPVSITPEQAHHLALIIGELATNTLKYRRSGERIDISVHIESADGEVRVVYRNQGPGYPEHVLAGEGHSVGLGLVRTLATRSLRGTWSLRNEDGPMTEIRFPIAPGLHDESTELAQQPL